MKAAIRRLQRVGQANPQRNRAQKVAREFDEVRGYERYHRRCKTYTEHDRNAARTNENLLRTQGFDFLEVLDAEDISRLVAALADSGAPSRIKKDSDALAGWSIVQQPLAYQLFSLLLNDPVSEQIREYFQSEFLVHWASCTITPAVAERDNVSFGWHCDKGPTSHLKLIVYLNSTDTHGGTTELLCRRDTAALHGRGATYGWSKVRTPALWRLSQEARLPLNSVRPNMRSGDAILFAPGAVLHKGVYPARMERRVVTLCILPSPVPWQKALQAGTLVDLRTDPKWHSSADDLWAMFGLPGPA